MKTDHHRRFFLLAVLLGFAALQITAGLTGPVRSCSYYVRILYMVEINIILTVSLALINGFTGQFSLGHAGFMAIGAYASTAITTIVPRLINGAPLATTDVSAHAVFIVALLAGGLAAGCVGFIIGFPSLRLRGDYLAIVTLAASEVIRALLRFSDVLGGPRGIPGIPQFTTATYLGLALVVCLWIMRNYVHSHFGRACSAVRDNEIAAACMGINTTFQKVSAFVMGAFFAGIAGALFAHVSQYINPDNFSILKSLDLLIFLYIGGAQTLSGAITGAAIFTLVPEMLRFINIDSWRMVIYPLLLIIVMRYKRDGIMGRREFSILVPYRAMMLRRRREGP